MVWHLAELVEWNLPKATLWKVYGAWSSCAHTTKPPNNWLVFDDEVTSSKGGLLKQPFASQAQKNRFSTRLLMIWLRIQFSFYRVLYVKNSSLLCLFRKQNGIRTGRNSTKSETKHPKTLGHFFLDWFLMECFNVSA